MPLRPTPDYAAGMWSHCFTPRTAGERRYWLNPLHLRVQCRIRFDPAQ